MAPRRERRTHEPQELRWRGHNQKQPLHSDLLAPVPEVWKDVDMTDKKIDVQLKPLGVSLVDLPDYLFNENLPGEIHLNWDDVSDLRDKLNEAWFNRYGLQPMSVQVQ